MPLPRPPTTHSDSRSPGFPFPALTHLLLSLPQLLQTRELVSLPAPPRTGGYCLSHQEPGSGWARAGLGLGSGSAQAVPPFSRGLGFDSW